MNHQSRVLGLGDRGGGLRNSLVLDCQLAQVSQDRLAWWPGREDPPVGGLKITKKMGSWGRKENFVMTFSGIFLL